MIICLGQSLLDGGRVPHALALRVEHAAGVYQKLAAMPSGASLYVSGADVKGRGMLQPEGQVMLGLLQNLGVDEADIDVDVEALNTIENARNAIVPMRRRGASIATLVTSDFHMPRAAYIFKTVFAAEALDIEVTMDPAPSGLGTGAPRSGRRPSEINEWNFLERVQHETDLMQKRMVSWLLQYGYRSDPAAVDEVFQGLRNLAVEESMHENLSGKFRILSWCRNPLYHPLHGVYQIDKCRDHALIWKAEVTMHDNQVWTFESISGEPGKYRILSHCGKPLFRPLPGNYQHDEHRVYALIWNAEVAMHANQVWTLEPIPGKKGSYRIMSYDGKPLYQPLPGVGQVDKYRACAFLTAGTPGMHENQVWTLEAI